MRNQGVDSVLDNSFRLLEEIGRGGFGAVYRAVRIGAEGSGPVAVKLLNKNPGVSSDEYLRFQREAVLMSQLVHPGVVTVYELGEEAGCYFIVMEYVSGPNLRAHVKARGGRLPLTDILEVLVQAAEALEYVHGHNIVHRDIKPQNILVCEAQGAASRGDQRLQVKIVDFGVARLNDSPGDGQGNKAGDRRGGGEVVGTYSYMPPEATGLVDWPVDPRSDVYSLGVVAFELLAGRTPFHDLKPHEMMRAHVETPPPSIRSVRGHEVPAILEDIVRKCMEKDPARRYQSMFALMCDLERLQQGLRQHGILEEFPLASKDIGLGTFFNRVHVGRKELTDSVFQFVMRHVGGSRSRLAWGMLRGGVGVGKTRALQEIRSRLEHTDLKHIHLRFSESERRLPFQALSLCLNDHLMRLERYERDSYARLRERVRATLGDGVAHLAPLVAALRPLVAHLPAASLPPRPLRDAVGEDGADGEQTATTTTGIDWQESQQPGPRRFAAPNARMNQAFVELVGCLAEETGQLVFLFDDVHLADASTLALLQFMAEQVNEPVAYTILVSVRDRQPRSNLALEGFLRRLAGLRRRFQCWDLAPLDGASVEDFLRELGVASPSRELVDFVLAKTQGTPLQIHSLVKRMLAQNALRVVQGDEPNARRAARPPPPPPPRGSGPGAPDGERGGERDDGAIERRDGLAEGPADGGLPGRAVLEVDWDVLPGLEDGVANIEMLISQAEALEPRDVRLLRIAAVSHEACEFEFFRMDPDYSRLELETRLLTLVRRGFLEAVGDELAPIQRLAFVFAHEKIRNAVLGLADALTRREIHLALARHIEGLYKNPRREQVLLLAKHYDGAGDLVDADTAARAFLRAVRIHVRGQGHNLAKYYIEKTLSRAKEIPDDATRVTRLREVFEAEYSIHAAQGNLVAASDVCQQLIAITEDGPKKDLLKTFWAQLLLALGRQVKAHAQAVEVLSAHDGEPATPFEDWISGWNLRLSGTWLHRWYVSFVLWFFKAKPLPEVALHALALRGLAEFHGVEEPIGHTIYQGLKARVVGGAPSRWSAVYAMLEAALRLRRGGVENAYRTADQVERWLETRGHGDAARWARALRALWMDYPLGRTDRLFALLEDAKASQLPASGLLHFEGGGLRAWMRLLSPSSAVAKAADAGEQRRRRKADHLSARQRRNVQARMDAGGVVALRAGGAGAEGAGAAGDGLRTQGLAAQELFLESQSARRVLDAGENGQYTALALFSDALRYALFDKLEPLKRATEQLRRQENASGVGEAFTAFAHALQALVSGRHKEALDHYHAGIEACATARLSVISLPVSDGLRLAAMMLPIFAVGAQARGWPWGPKLEALLVSLDSTLRPAEGEGNPRRNAMTPLFEGFLAYMQGRRKDAFEKLGAAVAQARAQRLELLEAFGLVVMGTFGGQMKLARSREHFQIAFRTARDSGWKLLERQVLGLARRVKLDLGDVSESEKSVAASVARTGRGIQSASPVLASIQRLSESDDEDALCSEAAKLAMRALGTRQAAVFLASGDGRGKFTLRYHTHADQAREALAREGFPNEQALARLLPRGFEEPVKLVPLDFDDGAGGTALPPRSRGPGRVDAGTGASPGLSSFPALSALPTIAGGAAARLGAPPASRAATVAGTAAMRRGARPASQAATIAGPRAPLEARAPASAPATVAQSAIAPLSAPHSAPHSAPSTVAHGAIAPLSAPHSAPSTVARGPVAPLSAPLSAPATVAQRNTAPLSSPYSVPATVARTAGSTASAADRGSVGPNGTVRRPASHATPPLRLPAGMHKARAARADGVSAVRPSPGAARGEQRYLVLVAITFGKNLLGWIALPGMTLQSWSRRDAEQDLLLLGLHCGYLLRGLASAGAGAATPVGGTNLPACVPGSAQGSGAPAAFLPEVREGDASHRMLSSRVADTVRATGETAVAAAGADGEDDPAEIDGPLPVGVVIESCGRGDRLRSGPRDEPLAFERVRVFSLPRGRCLGVQWRLRGEKGGEPSGEEQARKLAGLIERHVDFFVESLRARNEAPRAQALALRLASDFSGLFEGFPSLKSFDEIALGFVVVDAPGAASIEGAFGSERFSFTGSSRVENEFLHEVAKLRGGETLVYRERARTLQGPCGWMFAEGRTAVDKLKDFARADFVESYLARRDRGEPSTAFGEILGGAGGEAPGTFRCIALLVVGEEYDERARA